MLVQKSKILEACIKLQNKLVENAKLEMQELQHQANEYGQPRDRYDSFRAQLLRKRDLFAEQLQNALDSIDILQRIDQDIISEEAEFGSVVITDKLNIFVSIGIGKFEVDGRQFFAVSTKVPVFRAIEGLKKGDSYLLNGNRFKIIDLY